MNFFKKLRQKKAKATNQSKEADSKEIDSKAAKPKSSPETVKLEEQKLLFKAAHGGQCGICRFAKLVSTSKDSHFVMCSHPQLPKYQGQPVLNCNCVDFRKTSRD